MNIPTHGMNSPLIDLVQLCLALEHGDGTGRAHFLEIILVHSDGRDDLVLLELQIVGPNLHLRSRNCR